MKGPFTLSQDHPARRAAAGSRIRLTSFPLMSWVHLCSTSTDRVWTPPSLMTRPPCAIISRSSKAPNPLPRQTNRNSSQLLTPMTSPGAPLLELRGITKSFPGVRALSDVNFTARAGEIHALMGENGAGKSTLIKVLTGVYGRDAGDILLNGA